MQRSVRDPLALFCVLLGFTFLVLATLLGTCLRPRSTMPDLVFGFFIIGLLLEAVAAWVYFAPPPHAEDIAQCRNAALAAVAGYFLFAFGWLMLMLLGQDFAGRALSGYLGLPWHVGSFLIAFVLAGPAGAVIGRGIYLSGVLLEEEPEAEQVFSVQRQPQPAGGSHRVGQVARALIACVLLVAGFTCLMLQLVSWERGYLFEAFGGPTQRRLLGMGVGLELLAALVYFCRGRPAPLLRTAVAGADGKALLRAAAIAYLVAVALWAVAEGAWLVPVAPWNNSISRLLPQHIGLAIIVIGPLGAGTMVAVRIVRLVLTAPPER